MQFASERRVCTWATFYSHPSRPFPVSMTQKFTSTPQSSISAIAQDRSATSTAQKILAGRLFDPYKLQFLRAQTITILKSSGLILTVEDTNDDDISDDTDTIDLRHLTILPGFVDAHVHFFLHSYGETSWDDQTTKESLVERTIRATVHARKTLMAGFTTVRDLGTEGAGDADISLRKCLSGPSPIIVGPRYFCANKAIVCTGSYGPKSSLHNDQEGVEGVTGAEVADGVEECIRATRRQIGAGADWIKIYADYRFRSRTSDISPRVATMALPTFNEAELQAMIDTAHALGVKAAAHTSNANTIATLLKLGIDSIEHGSTLTPHPDFLLPLLCNSPNTTWVPTLAVFYSQVQFTGGKDPRANQAWKVLSEMFQQAVAMGMENIACGGDTGTFPHGENALEMKLMVRLGADWKKVLRWGTLGGWECIRSMNWDTIYPDGGHGMPFGDNDHRFGCVRPGWAGDLVGVKGDFDDFEGTLDSIDFVMKAGRVYKQDGRELV
ncbi:hypothetical protein F5878DRAFT_581607 [Lentinula raphanica]|uniref:Amidohydrolase-related domain-containing protein n=1 Tax=Lentinula raphanica TaxID=153919 RepID=A0AA38UFQ7_9AGAR|nr:hypothetical protein F5878DRAFT_581607 [Lentinula raphanica]